MDSTFIISVIGVVVTYTGVVGSYLIHKYIPVAELNKLKVEAELVAAKTEAALKEVEAKQGAAYDAVRLIEDAYASMGGTDKLQKAIAWAMAKLTADGIKVTLPEVEEYVRIAFQDFAAQLNKSVPAPAPVPVPVPVTK